MKTPEEKRAAWVTYMDQQSWIKGQLDVSSWTTFLRAATLGVSRVEAMDAVCARISGAGGAVRAAKLESQCRRAYNFATTSADRGATWSPRPGWTGLFKPTKPTFDDAKLRAFAAEWAPHVNSIWLGNRSAVDPATVSAGDFLAALYQPGERVLLFSMFQSQGQLYWKAPPLGTAAATSEWEVATLWGEGVPRSTIEKLSGPDGVWFLAQPVDGEEHVNPREKKDGKIKMSRRSMESVTNWRYLVLESDQANARYWLGALVQLPLRLAAIYTSGGKSIHALVRVDASCKQHWDAECDGLEPILVTLGADPAALTAVRLTRLPGCYRGDKEQKLLYLNPRPSGLLPICALPPKRDVVEAYTRYADSCTGDEVDLEFKKTVVAGLKHYGSQCSALAERLNTL